MEQKLKDGIDVLRGCSERGAESNPDLLQWFEGYAKACDDIKSMVVDAAFSGKPLPVRFQPSNECLERIQT